MAKLKPGDKVDCRVKNNTIVNPFNPDYDDVYTFEIVAKDTNGYFIYVPHYRSITGTVKVDKYLAKQLNIDIRFLNENVIFIQTGMIYKINTLLDGLFCAKCHEYFALAEANQPDGTLICYTCRQNPYR